jgi:hypothetical protein
MRMALCGCAVLVVALAGPATYRYAVPHTPGSPPVIALGAAGLVCYTIFFLVCEAALLVLAVINIRDEKVHNKYKSLMLLVLYVFTFRYRRVLPARFFAETDSAPAGGGGPRGRRRQQRRTTTRNPPPSSPVTDEEIRAVALLIARMASTLGDSNDTTGPAADVPAQSRPRE